MLVLGLVTGCGSDGDAGDVATDSSATPSESASPSDDATPQATPSPTDDNAAPATWQTCADVWNEGKTLPKPYPGCALDGKAVPADSIHCSMGALLVTYDDRFWGVPGHEISRADGKLQQDADYRQDRATCTA